MTLQLAQIYGFEGTPALTIFIGGFSALLILGLFMMKVNARLLLIAATLFATALTAPVDVGKLEFVQTWMLPLQIHRAELHLAFALMLTALVLVRKDIHVHDLNFQGVMMMLIALYMGTLQFYHETALNAVQTLGFALATIPCMLFAVASLTRDYEGCLNVLRAMMYASIAWIFCCSVQFVINPRALVNSNGRFWGLLGNAQQAGILCAPLAMTAVWLLLTDPKRRNRIVWIAVLTINLLFIMWSGSRTGALMFVIGFLCVMWTRLGKALLFLPAAGLVFWLLWILSEELQIGANVERLVSTENTRSWVFDAQISSFLESPLVGVGWNDVGASESSYIGGLGAYGVGFGALVFTLFLGSVVLCVRLLMARKSLPRAQRPLVDLFVGYNALYFGGAAFEGYILARSSTALTMLLMFAPMSTYLLRLAAQRGEPATTYDDEDETAHEPTPATA
jgi:hypothetical protein